MEFVLLLSAILALIAHSAQIHIALFILHGFCGTWIALRLVKKQPLTCFFIVAYMAMYFPNPVAIMVGWIAPDSSDSVLYECNAMVLLGFDLFVVAARRLRRTRLDARAMPRIYLPAVPTEMCMLFALAVCAISALALTLAVAATGASVLTVGKSYRATGGNVVFYMTAVYSFMLLPLATFLIGLKRYAVQAPYLAAVLGLLVIHILVFQVRTSPVACVMAYVTAIIARTHFVVIGRRTVRGRLPALMRLIVFLSVPALPVLGVGFKYWRYVHTVEQTAGAADVPFAYILGETFAGGDLGYTYMTRRAMEIFPEQHPYFAGQSYYRLLFVPIPRAIWPGKPENTQRIFAGLMDPALKRAGVTIPPGIVGDLYANFGKLGVLGMLVFGAFFAQEKYRGLTDLVYLAGSGYWVFHLCRGSLTNPIVTMVFIWMIAAAFTKIIKPRPLTTESPTLRTPLVASPTVSF